MTEVFNYVVPPPLFPLFPHFFAVFGGGNFGEEPNKLSLFLEVAKEGSSRTE